MWKGLGKDGTTVGSPYQVFSEIPSNAHIYNSLEKTTNLNKSAQISAFK